MEGCQSVKGVCNIAHQLTLSLLCRAFSSSVRTCVVYSPRHHRGRINNLVSFTVIDQRQHPRNSSYILTVQNLTLTAKVRAILIDWLVEVALEFDFRDETLYLAVALVDKSLSRFRVRAVLCTPQLRARARSAARLIVRRLLGC